MKFQRTRWIPKGAIEVKQPDDLGVAYVYRIGERGYGVLGYGGKRTHHDFHFSYKTIEQAHDKIESWFSSLKGHVTLMADRRKLLFQPNSFKVGDIVVNSWGYDQTNVDWYKVTKRTDNFVWLQPISGHFEEKGFMCGDSLPSDKELAEPVEQHKAYGDHVCFKYGSGSKWDGRPMYESYYA